MSMFERFDPNPANRAPPFQGRIRAAHGGDAVPTAKLALHDAGAMEGLQNARDGIPLQVALEQRTKELTEPGLGSDRMLFVAEDAGAILGYGRARDVAAFEDVEPELRPPIGWYLLGMIVDPVHRRRGIGHALTEARLDWLRERTPEVFYFTRRTNGASIALHTAFGFKAYRDHFLFPRTGLEPGDGTMYRLAF